MAPNTVSDCVLSIIGVFASGLDVFRKFRELREKNGGNDGRRRVRKPRNSATREKEQEQEIRLARSLRQGPEDIGREYQMCHQSVGDHYALGDAIAHISLADIQLRLNTGLVNIIHRFLSRNNDPDSAPLDYESLLSLSEAARVDTCRTLRDLYRRITQMRLPIRVQSPPAPANEHLAAEQDEWSKSAPRTKQKSRPRKPRQPTIARVYIENSTKPSRIAIVKPAERKKVRNGSGTKSPTSPDVKSPKSVGSITPRLASSTPPSLYTGRVEKTMPSKPDGQTSPKLDTIRSQPTAAHKSAISLTPPSLIQRDRGSELPAQLLSQTLASQSSPHLLAWLETTPHSSGRSNDVPASHARSPRQRPQQRQQQPPPLPIRGRQNIPTYHSAQTASTRLGEIPLHRWAEVWDFEAAEAGNRAAAQQGWPTAGHLAVSKQADERRDVKKEKKLLGGGSVRFWSGWRRKSET